jgi:hypothetical protein
MKTFKKFDLPVKHLEGEGEHYVPPKARDPQEIERRHQLMPGLLMAEMQAKGIKIARCILEQMQDEEDALFATKTLGAAALNTAWYSFAQGAKDVMRRQLTLPPYDEYGEDVDMALIVDDAVYQLSEAEKVADSMVKEGHEKRRLYVIRKKVIGVKLGDAALTLGSAAYANLIAQIPDDPEYQQKLARRSALELLEQSRTLYKQADSNPTLAQLADKDSPLSVYWRRTANDWAYNALESAVEATN